MAVCWAGGVHRELLTYQINTAQAALDELPASSTLDILIGGMGMTLVGISGCWDNDVGWSLNSTESGP